MRRCPGIRSPEGTGVCLRLAIRPPSLTRSLDSPACLSVPTSIARQLGLEANWMPVRDQANGSVLIAIAREPVVERAPGIGTILASPGEFAVASSRAIRLAILAALEKAAVPLSTRLYCAMARPRN